MNRRKFFAFAALGLTTGVVGDPSKLLGADDQNTFSFVVIADPHIGIVPASLPGFEHGIADIGKLAEKPAFVITAGDIAGTHAGTRSQYTFYKDVIGRLNIPVYNVRGNHDDFNMFKEFFGPNYYSFDHGAFHFVVLDSSYPPHGATVTDAELKWLEQDLRGISKSTPIILILHYPLYSTLQQRCPKWKDAPTIVVPNPAEILAVFKTYNLKMVFTGHIHENEYLPLRDGVEHFTIGSIGGAYWGRNGYDSCWDGTPLGYTIVRVTGENAMAEYKATCRDVGDVMDIISPKEHMKGREGKLIVNVFSGNKPMKFTYRLDQGPWKRLDSPPKPILDPRIATFPTAIPSTHIWSDDFTVTEGRHMIKVQVTDQYGRIRKASRAFRSVRPPR